MTVAEEIRAEERARRDREIVKNCLKLDLSLEDLATITGFSIVHIKTLIKEIQDRS